MSVAASDFYGPLVRTPHAGERLVPALLAGKRVTMIGSLDQPHSFTYVPDLARAMITAARTPSLWGQVLHAPTGPAPTWVLRAAGLFSVEARELAETSYMFTRPFVLDSTHNEALPGLEPTPLEVAAKGVVDWWQFQSNG